MVWSMQYRAHLPKPINNVKWDTYAPLRAYTDMRYPYRAFARAQVEIPNYRTVSARFTFEYNIAPYIKAAEEQIIPFLREQLKPEDFGIDPARHKIFFTKPIALYSSGWFFDGIHKLPGFQGVDLFYSTVPPEDEGKPWWGEYYDYSLRELYNPPAEHAFAEDARSYIYTGNPNDPRVCCPALIPSYLWDRLRFFIRFFDTVYIFKPTEYARRQYYRFMEEDFPAIMRLLQGLSWLEPIELPSDVKNTPLSETSVFLTISLGEAYYSAWRERPSGEMVPGSEIIPAPDYLPEALRSETQARHLDRGKWKYSPDSGYWPAPTNPTWWKVTNFNTIISGVSLLHLLQYHNYDWGEEKEWARDVEKSGRQDRVFARLTTGYYDSQGNWIMPAFVNAVPPILIVNSTSGDVILLGLDDEERGAEHISRTYVCGDYKKRGRLGDLEYKVRFILTTRVDIALTGYKVFAKNAKGYAPPSPQKMAKALYPYFELVDYFTYPTTQFLRPEQRQLQYAPKDVNRFKALRAPDNITTQEGLERLNGIVFSVAQLPTGESSNVSAQFDDPNISINHFVDNLSVELPETIVGNSVRPWLEEHLLPALQFAIRAIKARLILRRYDHPRMIDDDVTIHQVKMRRGAPSPSFSITVTSKKEIVSARDYLSKVGVDLDKVMPDYHGKFKWAYRLIAPIWFPNYMAYPDEVGSFARLAKQLQKEGKTIADFPLERSPKVVVFRGAAVSPPELQFIPRYKVLVCPAIGLMWEWRYKIDNWVLSLHLKRWGWLVDASGDKDVWAELLRALTLQNIVQSDIAFLKYDAVNNYFYLLPYNQPIVASALITNEKTKTTMEYNVTPSHWRAAQRNTPYPERKKSEPDLVFNYSEPTVWSELTEYVWCALRELVEGYNLRDNPNEDVVESIIFNLAYQKLPPPPPTWRVDALQWARMWVKMVFGSVSTNFALSALGESTQRWAQLCGVRGIIIQPETESAPPVFSLTPDTQNRDYPFVIYDAKGGGAIEFPIGGVRSVTLTSQVDEENKNKPQPNKLQLILDEVARTEILLATEESLQPESVIDVGGLVFLSRLSPSRLRAGLFVRAARNNNWEYTYKDYDKYAYVLSSLVTYAPFIFADLRDPVQMRLFYPVDAHTVLNKPSYSQQYSGGVATGYYFPQQKREVKFSPRLSESWVFRVFPSTSGSTIDVRVIPPHQREPVKVGDKRTGIVALPVGEFTLQALPLWVLRCNDVPPEGALLTLVRGERYPPRAIRYKLPKFTLRVYPRVVTTRDDVYHELEARLIPDRVEVAKGEFDAKIMLKMPDGKDVLLYSPNEGDDEHWVELFCGAQGYYLPCYEYYRDKHAISTQPLWESKQRYTGGRALCMNFSAQEELWFDGVTQSKEDDNGVDTVRLRLDPRHPYHWRIYMNICLPHPILPNAFALVEKSKLSFVHLSEEPLFMFGLARWVSEPSPERYLWNERWSKNERPENLIKWWRAKLQSLGWDLPTIYTLEQSARIIIKGLNSVKRMLQENVKSEYFANEQEQQLYNNLVRYFTDDYKRLDYAPVAAYYSPSNMHDVDVVDKWINKNEPLIGDPFARTPACLVVMPAPHKILHFTNIINYYDEKAVETSPAIFIGAPALPVTRTISELDLVTAYNFLQEHAWIVFKKQFNEDYPRNHYYTFLPKRAELEAIAALYPHIYGKDIQNIFNMLKLLVWSPLNASVFVHPFYPNPFEVVRALKDALALGTWRAARFTYWELADVRFRHIGLYLPLRHFPYPHLLEALIAYTRARTRTNNIYKAWRRLCRPTVDFRLSALSAIPFTPAYLFQPTNRIKARYQVCGVTVEEPAAVIDEYLDDRFTEYMAELERETQWDYFIPAPVGGYIGSCALPAVPTPFAPFASLMFIKPVYYRHWMKSIRSDVGRVATDVPPWGARLVYYFRQDAVLDVFLQMVHDYAAIPVPGGSFPLHFSALMGALTERERAAWVKRFVTCNYTPIPYDGGFLWESMKYYRMGNAGYALLQSERNILLPLFPMFYDKDEMKERADVIETVDGETQQKTRRQRSWVFEEAKNHTLVWLRREIPYFTIASYHLPPAFSVIRMVRPFTQTEMLTYLETILRTCPQKELKIFMKDIYHLGMMSGVSYIYHLRSPLACWLVGAHTMVEMLRPYFPQDYLNELNEFMHYARVSRDYDPQYIEYCRSNSAIYWMLILPQLLNLK